MADSTSHTTLEFEENVASSKREIHKIREQFYTEIKNHQIKRNLYQWRTKKWINDKIRKITEFGLHEPIYCVEEISGIKTLRFTKNLKFKTSMQIVPIEDYFDVIYAAHMNTGHGNIQILTKYLLNMRLCIPYSAIIFFLKRCESCNFRKPKKTNKINKVERRSFLELIDMSDTPDGDDKFVMHYKVLRSKQLFLRPLVSDDATEVAKHLLELFDQIGQPNCLHTTSKLFTEAIIFALKNLRPGCEITCGRYKKYEAGTKRIKANILYWMSYNKSTKWSKIISHMSGFQYSTKILRSLEPKLKLLTDNNLLCSSSIDPSTIIEKEHKSNESNLQTKLPAVELLQLLKQSYGTPSIPKPVPYQTEIKVCKTYTRKKKEKLQIPLENNEEKPVGIKALCVDTNLKEISVKPSKLREKFHKVWNSTIDLPSQILPTVQTTLGMDLFKYANFGIAPKECVGLVDFSLCNEIGELSSSHKTCTDAMEDESNREDEPPIKPTVLEETKKPKEEKPFFVYADNCKEENSSFKDPFDINEIERKIKKEPLLFEIPITSNYLKTDDIKEEPFVCQIEKFESLDDE